MDELAYFLATRDPGKVSREWHVVDPVAIELERPSNAPPPRGQPPVQSWNRPGAPDGPPEFNPATKWGRVMSQALEQAGEWVLADTDVHGSITQFVQLKYGLQTRLRQRRHDGRFKELWVRWPEQRREAA